MPVIPPTQEAEAGELPEPRRRWLWWAEITPLHSSLGNRVRLSQKKKRKKKKNLHNENCWLTQISRKNGAQGLNHNVHARIKTVKSQTKELKFYKGKWKALDLTQKMNCPKMVERRPSLASASIKKKPKMTTLRLEGCPDHMIPWSLNASPLESSYFLLLKCLCFSSTEGKGMC